jgi:hypothetical protein
VEVELNGNGNEDQEKGLLPNLKSRLMIDDAVDARGEEIARALEGD